MRTEDLPQYRPSVGRRLLFPFSCLQPMRNCLLVLALFALSNPSLMGADDRPNILIMMADDWNWPHLPGVAEPNIETPTFDWLRREGITFRQAFVDSPSCTPSRAAFLTGRHPWELETGVNLWGALPATFHVFPELLEKSGYTTGYSGKGWGPGRLNETGRTHNPAGKVRSKDFQEFYRGKPSGKPFCFWFNTGDPHRPYAWQSGRKSGKRPQDVAVPPLWPDNEVVRDDLCDYLFEVERFDSVCGKMVAFLKEKGEIDNTLILMTGDNGMPFPRAKMTLYDLGTHVPLAMRWPAVIGKGRVVEDMVSLSDLAPTFLEIAGVVPPSSMTSRSLLPLLRSKKSGLIDASRMQVFSSLEQHCGRYPRRAIQTHDFLYIRNYETDRPINLCREYWEGESGYSPTWIALKELDASSEMFLRVAGRLPSDELYRLSDDPFQLNNLAEVSKFASVRQRLRSRLEKEQISTADPRILGTFEEVFYGE